LRAQSAELDRLLSDVPAAQAPATASASEAPQAGLDRAGLQGLYRIDTLVADAPPGAGKPPPAKAWRIEFSEPVPATRVFPWLLDVAARADLEVTGIAIDRADAPETSGAQAPGRVRGVVDLQSTPLYKDGP
jgi:type II secretory pathway component PulM